MEALREAKAKLTVYVHPSNAADISRAVARQLSTLLFSYEDRFDGALLAHKFTVDKGEKAKILNGLVPYFGVPVHADLLLFSPQPDMILEGKVEMLGKESIHAIVLGVFSAAIMSDDISEKFKFKRKRGRFISRTDKHHVIEKGSMIRFFVKRVDTEMNCHITGSLIPPHTGSMRWLSVHDAEYASEINRCGYANAFFMLLFKTDFFIHSTYPSLRSIQVEQNEQYHKEDEVMNFERPYKFRKRSVEE